MIIRRAHLRRRYYTNTHYPTVNTRDSNNIICDRVIITTVKKKIKIKLKKKQNSDYDTTERGLLLRGELYDTGLGETFRENTPLSLVGTVFVRRRARQGRVLCIYDNVAARAGENRVDGFFVDPRGTGGRQWAGGRGGANRFSVAVSATTAARRRCSSHRARHSRRRHGRRAAAAAKVSVDIVEIPQIAPPTASRDLSPTH